MSKSIGILTYHRAYNYGSVLQAYALSKYLRGLGYRVETIDLHTKRQSDMYRIFESCKGIKSILRNMQSFVFYKDLVLQRKKFEQFLASYLPMSNRTYIRSEDLNTVELNYDYYICGSDQIWNPNCIDFDMAYLLSFVNDKESQAISYAASIATAKIDNYWESVFRKELTRFKALSVREKTGCELIKRVTGRDVRCVLDPVFLLSKNEWDAISSKEVLKFSYILCYFIGDVPNMRSFAIRMSKKLNLPLVVVNKNIRDMLYPNKKLFSAGPLEFISLVKNADYICTNSFHAVAFSTIYEKKFWVFIDDQKQTNSSSRIIDFAKLLGISNRIITPEKVDVDYVQEIDYSSAREILNDKVIDSQNYIFESLQ